MDTVQNGLAGIVQDFVNDVAVDFVPRTQAMGQGKAPLAFEGIAQIGGRQVGDIHHHGAGVVAVAWARARLVSAAAAARGSGS